MKSHFLHETFLFKQLLRFIFIQAMRFDYYFNTSINLIQQYKGGSPFAYWLKEYFAQNKKHGSKDRKHIVHLCYCYFRLGHTFKSISVAERLRTALFLCNAEAGEWKILFEEKWLQHWRVSLQERIDFVKTTYKEFDIEKIFPMQNELGEETDHILFAQSHLIQPDLFLRIRPHKEKHVIDKLQENKIEFNKISNACL